MSQHLQRIQFLATITQNEVSVNRGDPVPFDDAPINPGGHFDTTLHAYVVPMDGYYQ